MSVLSIVMVTSGDCDFITTFVSNLATVQKLSLFSQGVSDLSAGEDSRGNSRQTEELEFVPFTSRIPYARIW